MTLCSHLWWPLEVIWYSCCRYTFINLRVLKSSFWNLLFPHITHFILGALIQAIQNHGDAEPGRLEVSPEVISSNTAFGACLCPFETWTFRRMNCMSYSLCVSSSITSPLWFKKKSVLISIELKSPMFPRITKVRKDPQDNLVQPSSYHQFFSTKTCPLVKMSKCFLFRDADSVTSWTVHSSTWPFFHPIAVYFQEEFSSVFFAFSVADTVRSTLISSQGWTGPACVAFPCRPCASGAVYWPPLYSVQCIHVFHAL